MLLSKLFTNIYPAYAEICQSIPTLVSSREDFKAQHETCSCARFKEQNIRVHYLGLFEMFYLYASVVQTMD